MRQTEMAVNVAEQPSARKWVRLINFVADFCEVSSATDQFAGDVISARTRARVLELTGIG